MRYSHLIGSLRLPVDSLLSILSSHSSSIHRFLSSSHFLTLAFPLPLPLFKFPFLLPISLSFIPFPSFPKFVSFRSHFFHIPQFFPLPHCGNLHWREVKPIQLMPCRPKKINECVRMQVFNTF